MLIVNRNTRLGKDLLLALDVWRAAWLWSPPGICDRRTRHPVLLYQAGRQGSAQMALGFPRKTDGRAFEDGTEDEARQLYPTGWIAHFNEFLTFAIRRRQTGDSEMSRR
jgi:hypothetical protein